MSEQAVEKLKSEILADARKKAAEITQSAEEEKKRILQAAQQQADALYEKLLNEFRADAENLKKQKLARLEIDQKMELVKKKEELVQKVFNEAKERLKQSRGSDRYKKTLQELAIKGIIALEGGNVEILVSKEDMPLLDVATIKNEIKSQHGIETNVEVKTQDFGPHHLGGLIVKKGNIWVDNTWESIIDRNLTNLRLTIAKTLFS